MARRLRLAGPLLGSRGVTDLSPSPAQAAAIREIKDWFENRTTDQQVFRMFGYAGSGKSTVLRFALDELGPDLRCRQGLNQPRLRRAGRQCAVDRAPPARGTPGRTELRARARES